MMPIYQLHPMVVHFPIALLLVGVLVATYAAFTKRESALSASAIFFWTGFLSLWVTFGLGWLAMKTAPHIPAAWEIMASHKEAAEHTVEIFSALAVWRFFRPQSGFKWFVLAWWIGVGAMMATGYFGGHLVFSFGMGVGAPQ
ncbi:MAG: hypothetical protein JO102_05915 [Elusimicrobia bacterium]|nr:hypothetical protein [Elusimicrobiota bacterium]